MLIIKAKTRKKNGKGASRRLRVTNKLPAIIYGGTESPIAIELEHNDLLFNQKKKDFYNSVLVLVIDDREKKVMAKVQALQYHPFKPKLIHIDFLRV